MNPTEDIRPIREPETGAKMYELIQRLYPLCRSITGEGTRETLQIIAEHIPLKVHEVPTGTKVFDWTVPEEWNIEEAYIETEAGERIIQFSNLNLHVLNYSTPVDQVVDFEELQDHIFTLPEQPDVVPYRTSYHKRQWGFCMSHRQFKELNTRAKYHVRIDSTLENGALSYGECYIRGEKKDEILISCHICHPSLCNDNLSGIAVATYLAKLLSTLSTKYSYRFLFIPGTIGSITWLSRNTDHVYNIKAGLVLTLLGDNGNFTYKRSRRGNTLIDHIVERLLKDSSNEYEIRDFSPYGYDERQYCSPGFDLPVGRLSRTPHGEFPEYHTSADNLQFVHADKLAESYRFVAKICNLIEQAEVYMSLNPYCEPQLGKRGLYKSVGGQNAQQDYQMALLWLLNLSDGNHTLKDIADQAGLPLELIQETAKNLVSADLLKRL